MPSASSTPSETVMTISKGRLLSEHQMSQIVSRAAYLEDQNTQLEAQVTKLQDALELCQANDKMEAHILAVLEGRTKPIGGKTAQIEELRKLNRELVEAIQGLLWVTLLLLLILLFPLDLSILFPVALSLSLSPLTPLPLSLSPSLLLLQPTSLNTPPRTR
jgi:hypothetical protein